MPLILRIVNSILRIYAEIKEVILRNPQGAAVNDIANAALSGCDT